MLIAWIRPQVIIVELQQILKITEYKKLNNFGKKKRN